MVFVTSHIMHQSIATCLPANCCFSVPALYKDSIQHVGLVRSRNHHNHFIECNLFSPWYGWKIAHLVLNNNHSLI